MGTSVIEHMLPLLLSEGVNKGRLTIERLVELCCYNPADIYGLAPRKGRIAPGYDADLVLVDLEEQRTIRAEEMISSTDFSVFEGWDVTGWPVRTWLRGTTVAENHQLTTAPGVGRWIAANT